MKVSVQITWRCDIRCDHCNQDHLKVDVHCASLLNFLEWVRCHVGLDAIGVTGGEPFMNPAAIEAISSFSLNSGTPFGIITNARWAKTYELALGKFQLLQERGLNVVTVSSDRYHEEFVPSTNVSNVLESCKRLRIPTFVYCTTENKAPEHTRGGRVPIFLKRLETLHPETSVRRRFALPVGHSLSNGIGVNFGSSIENLNLTCPQKKQMTVWPNGDVLPCCSAGTHANLKVGNIYEDEPSEIYKNYCDDPILKVIREFDISGLLALLPSVARDVVRGGKYNSACHVCMEVNSRPDWRQFARLEAENFDPLSTILPLP